MLAGADGLHVGHDRLSEGGRADARREPVGDRQRRARPAPLAADTEVFVLPLFGIAFIFQVMPMILQGGTVVLDGAFDAARTWELLERHRATRVFLAPTMLDTMLALQGHESRDVSSLHTLNTAYEFPEAVRRRAQERFGDIVHYMYGLSEAQLCCSDGERVRRRPDERRARPGDDARQGRRREPRAGRRPAWSARSRWRARR